VGTGQLINAHQNDLVSYQDSLDEARRRQLEPAVASLTAVASRKASGIAKHWEQVVLGPPDGPTSFTNVARILTTLVSAPQYSLVDDLGFIRGQKLSLDVLIPQMQSVDLTKLGLDFAVPVFFFEGRRDFACRPSLVWDYEKSISAPKKDFIWFERSGHFAFCEEQPEFADRLVSELLPLAK
jgi:pimeloyl-ACP methyl ester carboxylesterase